jgi:DNA primase
MMNRAPVAASKLPEIEHTPMLGPIRLAISLLIQAPHLGQKITLPEGFALLNFKGIAIINKIMTILGQKPQQTTGSLLEYFKDQEKTLVADLAGQEILIPNQAWEVELKETLDWIMTMSVEETIKELMGKGNRQGLTEKEKLQLQQMLSARK